MKMLSYVFDTSLEFSSPVSKHNFVLRCMPKNSNTQKAMEAQVFTDPRVQLDELIDGFGNRVVLGYCPEEHDRFDFYASGIVLSEPEGVGATPAHPMYSLPTLLTQPDEAMLAAVMSVTGASRADGMPHDVQDAWKTAVDLCKFLHAEFAYEPGATSTDTTASEAFAARRGVCQDYSHVLIAMCRALGIPARYTTGLMVGEGATHAWVEIHDGERWRGLDPTNDRPVNDDYILFCHGRDFTDCPIERGVFRGNAEQVQKVSASVGADGGAMNVKFSEDE